ncbi:MAG TPA: DUF4349 domain-containing protein [Vicinamibacterales bacterium]|nr:DUF4349 domain-containing protein [Vicinamibacterales bacterium]
MHSVEHPIPPDEVMALCDGELAPARASEVRAHVLTCVQCRVLSGDLGQLSRDLAGWTVEAPPHTLRATAPTQAAPKIAWWTRRVPAWTMYSVTGAAVAGLALMVGAGLRPATRSLNAVRQAPITSAEPAPAGADSPAALSYPEALKRESTREAVALGGVARERGASLQGAITPRVVRTANLTLSAPDFDGARSAIDRILADAGGFVGTINVSGTPPDVRRISAALRVPADRLSSVLTALRALGTVIEETQSVDDVTDQVLDLESRIANGRNTEKRLNDLLQRRTGKLSDVLEAEREVARVREEIERLDAQRKNIDGRVTYATITLHVNEPQKSTLGLGPLPLSTRMRNAAVDGLRLAFGSLAGLLVFLLGAGPFVAVWAAIIGATLLMVRGVRRRLHASGE